MNKPERPPPSPDDVLRRMLNTPPVRQAKKAKSQKPKKAGK